MSTPSLITPAEALSSGRIKFTISAMTAAMMTNEAIRHTGRRVAASSPLLAEGKYTRSKRPMIRLTRKATTHPRTSGNTAAHTAPSAAKSCREYITPIAARNANSAARPRRAAACRVFEGLPSMPLNTIRPAVSATASSESGPYGRAACALEKALRPIVAQHAATGVRPLPNRHVGNASAKTADKAASSACRTRRKPFRPRVQAP